MYYTRFHYFVATAILCSFWLQGCQSNFQLTAEEPVLKKSRRLGDDEQPTNQMLVPDVQSPVLRDVRNGGLPVAAPEVLPSVAVSTVRVESPEHHLAVMSDAVHPWQQALSAEFEETDTKPSARPTAQIVRSSSMDRPASLHESSFQVPVSIFGPQEWSQYFGEVREAPPLSEDMVDILHSPCPFWAGRSVKDTHLLVLIPSTVAGKPFSLNLLGELINNPKGGGHPIRYSFYDSDIQKVLGDQSPAYSYWVLMTRDVLEDSRNKEYSAQEALVAVRARETGLPYGLPGVLEAATVILSHYVRGGERLYSDSPSVYTRCRESVKELFSIVSCPVVVGGLSAEGLFVSSGFSSQSNFSGVASIRKFGALDP
jgi:hypothetical protein